jgi:hypothetical protein
MRCPAGSIFECDMSTESLGEAVTHTCRKCDTCDFEYDHGSDLQVKRKHWDHKVLREPAAALVLR